MKTPKEEKVNFHLSLFTSPNDVNVGPTVVLITYREPTAQNSLFKIQ